MSLQLYQLPRFFFEGLAYDLHCIVNCVDAIDVNSIDIAHSIGNVVAIAFLLGEVLIDISSPISCADGKEKARYAFVWLHCLCYQQPCLAPMVPNKERSVNINYVDKGASPKG